MQTDFEYGKVGLKTATQTHNHLLIATRAIVL